MEAKQVFFGSAERTDSTSSTSFVDLVYTRSEIYNDKNIYNIGGVLGSARLTEDGRAIGYSSDRRRDTSKIQAR